MLSHRYNQRPSEHKAVNPYLFKLRHIIPVCIGSLWAITVSYALLRWLLTFQFKINGFKTEVWEFYLPMTIALVTAFLLLRKRIRVIKDSNSSKLSWRDTIKFAIAITLGFMMYFSQNYVFHRFSGLQEFDNMKQVEAETSGYHYHIKEFEVDQERMGYYVESRSIPKRIGSDLKFQLYVVYPFKGTTNHWYARNFSKTINSSTMNETRIQEEYGRFISNCTDILNNQNFARQHTFERVPSSDDLDGYVRAVQSIEKSASDPIIFKPIKERYTNPSHEQLAWVFKTFVIGTVIMSILLLFAPLDPKKVISKGQLKRASNSDDEFGAIISGILIPKRNNWPLALIIDAIILYFMLMTFFGVNILSPSGQELFEWGGLRKEALLNGEVWRLITSMFMHGGLWHLISNLVTLAIGAFFACSVFGIYKTAIIYLSSGVCAGLIAVLYSNSGTMVGASGAIMGLMGAVLIVYVIHREKAVQRFIVWWILITIGASLLIGMSSGISNTAHIAGLISGAVLGVLCYKKTS